jgi:hypothetical protein
MEVFLGFWGSVVVSVLLSLLTFSLFVAFSSQCGFRDISRIFLQSQINKQKRAGIKVFTE